MLKSVEGMLRKSAFRLLGEKGYLKLLNKSFFLLYRLGFLKGKASYRYHYYVRRLIHKGDTILDIGANLGYYTRLFSAWTGPEGKVYAIEPVKPYNEILSWATKNNKNVTILPYALGTEEKDITMVTPGRFGFLRTGLPFVFDKDNEKPLEEHEFTFPAKMRRGSKLFKDLQKISYIKCDIEGYEEFVLPEMKEIILQHKPILQVETWGKHKAVVDEFLKSLAYTSFVLSNGSLAKASDVKQQTDSDYIYIHAEKIPAITELIGTAGSAINTEQSQALKSQEFEKNFEKV